MPPAMSLLRHQDTHWPSECLILHQIIRTIQLGECRQSNECNTSYVLPWNDSGTKMHRTAGICPLYR